MINGALIKILINYSQTTAILHSLHLNWAQQIVEVFNVHQTASGGIQQVIGLECLLKGNF